MIHDEGETSPPARTAPPSARSARFLTDLADVLRDAGVPVIEWPGWQTRRRNGDPHGYAAGRPNHVIVHHTASNPSTDGDRDAALIATGASTSPIYNVYVRRDGVAYVIAAGPTNNAGRGSCGPGDGVASWDGAGTPDDLMNSWSIGIALANTGTGEPYPRLQVDTLVTACAAFRDRYSIATGRIRGHREWTRRKIDPAGPSPWATGSAGWNMDQFRADLPAGTHPTPPATLEDEPMFALRENDPSNRVWIGNGVHRRAMRSNDDLGHVLWMHAAAGRPVRDALTGAPIIGLGDVSVADTPDRWRALGEPVPQ